MSFIANNIKAILEIKIKTRHDSYTDQFSRIFMVKMFIISSLVIGIDWFHDTVACIVPHSSDLSSKFVHSACWIQGFYIYPEMKYRITDSNYYGLPKDMDIDGVRDTGELCATYTRQGSRNADCQPMKKLYYLQYQYMPFFVASMAVLLYMPYVLFRIINTDMVSLRTTLGKGNVKCEEISNYFNYQVNSMTKMRIRVVMNVCVKIVYILVNVMTFFFTDMILHGNFVSYGVNYTSWSKWNHTAAYSFFEGNAPKPGNILLPSFGFCEIQEARLDIRHVFFNKNKFICEISPNILYQYVLLVLWFVMVISIVISIIGLFLNIAGHIESRVSMFCGSHPARGIHKLLSLRENEYLTLIRRNDIPLYGDILRYLSKNRPALRGIKIVDPNSPEFSRSDNHTKEKLLYQNCDNGNNRYSYTTGNV